MVGGSCEQRGSLRAGRLWTLPFILLLPAALLGYANIYLLVPTIPRYFERLGGSDADLGAAMATVTAAQDVGISSGAFVAGQIAGFAGLGGVYAAFAALAFVGFGLAAWRLLAE